MEVKKLLWMRQVLWDRIESYRWANRIQSESEAMRLLIEKGLDAEDRKAERKKR
jgi:hypothetical protein